MHLHFFFQMETMLNNAFNPPQNSSPKARVYRLQFRFSTKPPNHIFNQVDWKSANPLTRLDFVVIRHLDDGLEVDVVPLFDLLVAARDRPAPRERRLRRSAAGRFSAGRLDGTLGGDGVEVHPEGEGGSLGFGEVGEGHGQLRGGGGRWWFTRCLIQETIIRVLKVVGHICKHHGRSSKEIGSL